MIAIADAIGGKWPTLARAAAMALSGGPREEVAGVELLEDIQALFAARQVTKLTSAELVDVLGKMEDRPWSEWRQGKPITSHQVARLLEPFKIKPKVIRTGIRTPRGYYLDDFGDAFARYIPERHPSRTATPQQSRESGVSEPTASATRTGDVAHEIGCKTSENSHCCDVADQTPARPGSQAFVDGRRDGDGGDAELVAETSAESQAPPRRVISLNWRTMPPRCA
jgi:hypothetical protein